MSAGVRGFRVGTGPRGGYVHAGRHGVYYRQTLGKPRPMVGAGKSAQPVELRVVDAGAPMDDLTGPDVEELVAAMPSDIIRRIDEAAQLPKPKRLPNPFNYKSRVLLWQAERAVPLFYELDDDLHAAYELVVGWGEALARSHGRYYDVQEQRVSGAVSLKGNAGADVLVERTALGVSLQSPAAVTLNFEPPALQAPDRSIYFLPDLLLIEQHGRYATLPYQSLRFEAAKGSFITSTVPPGVQPIGFTWKYRNKAGGPDKRYSDNPQIPIIETTELDFHHPSGFQFHTAFTDNAAATNFVAALRALIARLPTGQSLPPPPPASAP